MSNLVGLIPISIFLVVAFALALWARSLSRKGKGADFATDYFIGNRSLGGFVLALTTVATYGSVSSFVGGPGQAWSIGFGWVYMATVQVTALILLYGILGKKVALVSRKTGAVTVIDIIRDRYKSDLLADISSIIIVLFFLATMVAQFVGGAKLFEAVTGLSYTAGLALFGSVAVIFTAIGGFRGVAFTDVLCGVLMIVGLCVLGYGIVSAGGGYESIMTTIAANHPEMLEPLSGGNMPVTLYFTQWLLVGIFTFCLPQSVVRCIGAKDTASLHRAMIIGTVVIGFMMIVATSLGVLAAGILPGSLADYGGSVDNIIPAAIVTSLPPIVADIAIIGPVAASISTVSSLLIVSSSSLIKDIYQAHQAKAGKTISDKSFAWGSQGLTLVIGIIVFALSIVPPDVIWKINMFAFGGLETAFCWVLVFGLFWKRATKEGALLSMVGGTLAYCIAMALGFKLFGMHQITIGISVSLILMVIGSLASKAPDIETLRDFFPKGDSGESSERTLPKGAESENETTALDA